ncbi:hypothetical protein QUF90_05560 [Desulfococcaceae bacterium HSG9]|nr:hypothetical protein [Desulfococcaceae bacterium HSG9]
MLKKSDLPTIYEPYPVVTRYLQGFFFRKDNAVVGWATFLHSRSLLLINKDKMRILLKKSDLPTIDEPYPIVTTQKSLENNGRG